MARLKNSLPRLCQVKLLELDQTCTHGMDQIGIQKGIHERIEVFGPLKSKREAQQLGSQSSKHPPSPSCCVRKARHELAQKLHMSGRQRIVWTKCPPTHSRLRSGSAWCSPRSSLRLSLSCVLELVAQLVAGVACLPLVYFAFWVLHWARWGVGRRSQRFPRCLMEARSCPSATSAVFAGSRFSSVVSMASSPQSGMLSWSSSCSFVTCCSVFPPLGSCTGTFFASSFVTCCSFVPLLGDCTGTFFTSPCFLALIRLRILRAFFSSLGTFSVKRMTNHWRPAGNIYW